MWDPVEALAIQTQQLEGQVCIWDYPPTPMACYFCFSMNPLQLGSHECRVCIHERHVYSHYLDDLVADAEFRPVCSNASDARPPVVPWWVVVQTETLLIMGAAAAGLLLLTFGCVITAVRRRGRIRVRREKLLADASMG